MGIRKITTFAAPVVVGALLLAGCAASDDDNGSTTPDAGPPSEPTGTVRINFGIAPTTWAPDSPADTGYLRVPYETLVTLGDEGAIMPNLATEWGQTATDLTLTLRDDVTFHDGEPFNAEAVKANLEYGRDNPGQYTGALQAIESIDVIDDTTVKINFLYPAPTFLTTLAQRGAFMASPASLADGSAADAPVGTGPWAYNAAESVDGTTWVFDATDDYWGESPGFETIELYAIADEAAAAAALLNGEIDVTDVEESQLSRIESSATTETLTYPAVRNNITFFDRGPGGVFENPEVRRAVCTAIDHQGMMDLPAASYLELPDQHFLEGDPGYNPDIEGMDYDVEAAQEMLDGATVEASFPSAPFLSQQLQYMADGMNQLEGVDISVQELPVPEFVTTWNSGQYALGVGQNQEMTPYDWYKTWFSADARNNPSGYESPELKAAADAAIAAGDTEEADALWQEVMRIIIDDEVLGCAFGVGGQIIAWNTSTVAGDVEPTMPYEVNLINLRGIYPANAE